MSPEAHASLAALAALMAVFGGLLAFFLVLISACQYADRRAERKRLPAARVVKS